MIKVQFELRVKTIGSGEPTRNKIKFHGPVLLYTAGTKFDKNPLSDFGDEACRWTDKYCLTIMLSSCVLWPNSTYRFLSTELFVSIYKSKHICILMGDSPYF